MSVRACIRVRVCACMCVHGCSLAMRERMRALGNLLLSLRSHGSIKSLNETVRMTYYQSNATAHASGILCYSKICDMSVFGLGLCTQTRAGTHIDEARADLVTVVCKNDGVLNKSVNQIHAQLYLLTAVGVAATRYN